jgi:hypothetical protein
MGILSREKGEKLGKDVICDELVDTQMPRRRKRSVVSSFLSLTCMRVTIAGGDGDMYAVRIVYVVHV